MNERTNERTTERTNDRSIERTNERTNERTTDRTNERTIERTTDRTNENERRAKRTHALPRRRALDRSTSTSSSHERSRSSMVRFYVRPRRSRSLSSTLVVQSRDVHRRPRVRTSSTTRARRSSAYDLVGIRCFISARERRGEKIKTSGRKDKKNARCIASVTRRRRRRRRHRARDRRFPARASNTSDRA